jgi:hypothetical protein
MRNALLLSYESQELRGMITEMELASIMSMKRVKGTETAPHARSLSFTASKFAIF